VIFVYHSIIMFVNVFIFQVVKRLILLRRLELPLVREAPTIIFGADMVEVEDSKSVASVCLSSS
jgi:hypothetical protein